MTTPQSCPLADFLASSPLPDGTAATVALAQSATAKLAAGAAITAAELGAMLGVDERTAGRLAREGRYPSQQPTGPGGARRFSSGDVAAIRAWSQRRTVVDRRAARAAEDDRRAAVQAAAPPRPYVWDPKASRRSNLAQQRRREREIAEWQSPGLNVNRQRSAEGPL